ncbi:MAG TPA: hypothetical protein VF532_20750, partial [Candidatus Angelobacter sp.]
MKRARKIILWTATGMLALMVLLAATFVLLVKQSPGFRRYLLAKVEASIYESSGARVQAQDFQLNLSAMGLALENLAVRGAGPAVSEPLLRVQHVDIGIAVDSVLGRKWHFREVTLRRPVVHLAVNKNGENNLPKPERTAGTGAKGIFDLGVHRLVVQQGEVYYNDRKSRLEADVRDLELTAGFVPEQTRYLGEISYARGKITYGDYAPVVHNLEAVFSAAPKKIAVEHLQLTAGKSTLSGNGTLENLSDPAGHPRLRANYDALLETSDIAQFLKGLEAPAGQVRVTGFLSYQSRPDRSLLESVSLWGMISSPELALHTATLQTTVRDLAAKYKLENGTAEVENLRAQLLGGRLEGRAMVRDLAGAGQGRIEASLKDVSLSLLQTASASNPVREAHVTGTINAEAQGSWSKTLKDLEARGNVTIRGALGQNPATPLEGVLHAGYSRRAGQLALHNSYLRTPQTSLTLDG